MRCEVRGGNHPRGFNAQWLEPSLTLIISVMAVISEDVGWLLSLLLMLVAVVWCSVV